MFRFFCALLILAWVGLYSSAVAAERRANLLLITVDDMNADSVGIFGSGVADITPNIDQLAREGLRFELAHVQVANCMPSRNVLWSGRYPQNNKVEGFYHVQDPGYLTLPDLLRKSGYFTAIRHKLNDSTPYSPYEWDAVLDDAVEGTKPGSKDAESYGISTAIGIRSAKAAGKPFCLMINIADPHVPLYGLDRKGREITDPFKPSRVYHANEVQVPGYLPDDPVVRQELAHYFSSVRRADDAVGQILLALKESGEADNTLVMFLSDHGMPFPFAKTQLYHQSTRTPLIFRWPGVTKENSVDSEHMVSAVDVLPTLLDSIGAQLPPGLDGRSFKPLLKGESQEDRDKVFKAYNENSSGQRSPMRAVQSPKFLYIFNPWSNGNRAMFSATFDTRSYARMLELAKEDIRIADRVNLLRHRVLEEFYDVQKDPDGLVNLADDPAYQSRIEQYRVALAEWLRAMNDPMLAALIGRKDTNTLDQYMREQQGQAEDRKARQRVVNEKLKKQNQKSRSTL